MIRFAFRHFTAILILAAIAAWGIFYLPYTPTWSVLRLKQAIDARDGNEAARYVDFQSVVQHAGYEMVQNKGGTDPLTNLVGKAAVDLFTAPMAGALQSWVVQQVNDGNKDLQMPGSAVAGSLIVLHRNGDTAYSTFTDNKGQVLEVHLARAPSGYWQVVEVKNVGQLLQKLQQRQQHNLQVPGAPP